MWERGEKKQEIKIWLQNKNIEIKLDKGKKRNKNIKCFKNKVTTMLKCS
jgi:hypothetical protein